MDRIVPLNEGETRLDRRQQIKGLAAASEATVLPGEVGGSSHEGCRQGTDGGISDDQVGEPLHVCRTRSPRDR